MTQERKFVQWSWSHDQDGRHAYMVKPLQKSSTEPEGG